jgi:hypothetical protein
MYLHPSNVPSDEMIYDHSFVQEGPLDSQPANQTDGQPRLYTVQPTNIRYTAGLTINQPYRW